MGSFVVKKVFYFCINYADCGKFPYFPSFFDHKVEKSQKVKRFEGAGHGLLDWLKGIHFRFFQIFISLHPLKPYLFSGLTVRINVEVMNLTRWSIVHQIQNF